MAPTRKAEQSEATRGALLGVARALFAERGYADAATEEVVRRAEVTRGALYYHFKGKEDLFEAVFVALQTEVTAAVATAALAKSDPWDQLTAGVRAFLDACSDPGVRQIVLLDAPAVLGWHKWREIEEQHGLGLMQGGLQTAMDAGLIREQPVEPLSHVLLGALNEAAMVVAHSPDDRKVRRQMVAALESLLEGLRA